MSEERTDQETNPLRRLIEAGARYERLAIETTVSYAIAGLVISSERERCLRYDWHIPVPTGVEASFSHEGLREKFKKLFERELQMDDPPFDRAVFIATEREADTARFLADDVIRAIIARVVEPGGVIILTGQRVLYELAEPDAESPENIFDMARLVAAAIEFEPEDYDNMSDDVVDGDEA